MKFHLGDKKTELALRERMNECRTFTRHMTKAECGLIFAEFRSHQAPNGMSSVEANDISTGIHSFGGYLKYRGAAFMPVPLKNQITSVANSAERLNTQIRKQIKAKKKKISADEARKISDQIGRLREKWDRLVKQADGLCSPSALVEVPRARTKAKKPAPRLRPVAAKRRTKVAGK